MNKLNYKIKCIGFSVTGYGKPSYPLLLEEKLTNLGANVNVDYTSLGGLSVDALIYLLDSIVGDSDFDLVVLEISTSWFSIARKNQADADFYVKEIVNYFLFRKLKVVFLNLFRKDISDSDTIVSAIDNFRGDYTVLDLKSKYRKRLLQGEGDGTTDGVHPEQSTIVEISDELANLIFNELTRELNYSKNVLPSKFNILLPRSLGGQLFSFDNRHGLVIDCMKISNVKSINLAFGEDVFITGVFFMYGPDSSGLNMSIGNESIDVPMYDEMSFYKRLGYKGFGKRKTQDLNLNFNFDAGNVTLKKDPWELVGERSCYIVGFSVSA